MTTYLVQPTPAEAALGITAEQLGVHALVPDASPAARAHAEAVWRPADAGDPCRCSGTHCAHGAACGECPEGRRVHLDRIPGSMFDTHVWADEYDCTHCYDGAYQASIELPDLPWGRSLGDQRGIEVFAGVRHPNFGNGGGTLSSGSAPAR